jgi:hypothetical protein
MKKIFFLLLSFSAMLVQSQKLTITGTLQNELGEPLEMANVVLLNATDNSMSSYGFTDEKGRFKLKAEAGKDYVMRFSYLGLETLDKPINTASGADVTLDPITLKASLVQLQEAEVIEEMPISVVGDTIIYQAEAFNTGEERKLEDVLKNLPGFEVDDNGEVKVQGKTVEKVMVEGQDFFDGDTKLATKNIPANAVDKVQVLRDYNDVNPMRGVDNDDRIALNIKLKDGKKNIFFGDVSAQGGIADQDQSARYYGHANLFYYSPKASYNFIGDANNIGEPAFTAQDYFRFSGGLRNLNRRSGSNLNIANDNFAGAFGRNNRAQNVVSEFGALNATLNPTKSFSLSGFAIVNRTNTDVQSSILRRYLTGGVDSLTEVLQTNSNQENASALAKVNATYTPNTALHIDYDGTLKLSDLRSANARNSDFGIFQTNLVEDNRQLPVETRQSVRAFYEENDRNISSFEGQYFYKYQDPIYAFSSPDRPLFLIPLVDTNSYQLQQTRAITTHKADLNFNHFFILNKTNHINILAGSSITRQGYNSAIEQQYDGVNINDINDPNYLNDFNYLLDDYFVGLRYKTKFGKLVLSPGVNLHRYRYDISPSPQTDILYDKTLLLPEFFAKYDFKKTESLTFNYAMQAQFTDINNFVPNLIINSYNSLFRGNTQIDNALVQSFTLGYYNFNMFNFTNIFAGVTYNRSIDALVTATRFDNLQRVLSPINADGFNDVVAVYGSFEKRFTKLKVGLSTNYAFSQANTLIDDVQNTNSSFTQVYNFSVESNFKNAPNVEVGFQYTNNFYDGGFFDNTFVTNRPYAEVEVPFLKTFVFTADYAYNNYRSNGETTSNFDFLNATLYYQQDDSPWEFTLSGMNLLNTDIIREDGFSENLISTSTFQVMPRYLLGGVKYDL